MTVIHRNGFEGQPDGGDFTTANSVNSGNQLTKGGTIGTGTIKYTSSHPTTGLRAIELIPQPTFTLYVDDTGYDSANLSFARGFYYPGPPSASQTLFQFRSTAGQHANVTVTTSGRLQMQNISGVNVGQSALTLIAGHIYRVEAQCFSDAALGKLRLQYFVDNAGAAVESLTATGDGTSLNTRGGNMSFIRSGFPGTTNGWPSLILDDFQGQDIFASLGAFPINVPPTANAGPDQGGIEPYAVVVASGSATDSDGTIASYAWTQIAGPTVTLTSSNTASPSFIAPPTVNGTRVTLSLVVTDDKGATSPADTVNFDVLPHSTWRMTTGGPSPVQVIRL